MAYKTCEDCGSRIFEYGCVNCFEEDYIAMQDYYNSLEPVEKRLVYKCTCSNGLEYSNCDKSCERREVDAQ